MTYTLITTVETSDLTIAYPAIKGLTGDQIQDEKNRVRALVPMGSTITFKVI
jgi:hypothetical protein